MTPHTTVWIDHRKARIFHVTADAIGKLTVAPPQHIHCRHPVGTSDDAKQFFHEVARTLDGSQQILVVGPSTAKLDFIRYLHTHDRALELRIAGIESVDHPTDGQLAAYARSFFKLDERP